VSTPFFFSNADQTWGATSESNFGKWVNQDADALLKKGLQEGLDEAKGADLLNQANELMAKDFYVLPLFQRANFQIARDTFANIRPNATDAGPTYNVSEWGLRTTAE
jgi:peptide/nickel transport system substrate-binding protein